ncbi:hypothetical protein SeMB42_g06022, partial [Synchytrium endobioticum]
MKNPSKGRLLDEVFLLPPEMLAKGRYMLDNSQRRYVRTSSFKTNGPVLPLLWIDTTSQPPPTARKVEDAINLPNIFKNDRRTERPGPKQYKRKRWDADETKHGELDKVLEGIVNMVGESMGSHLERDERPAYLKSPSKNRNTPMKRKADE